MKTVTCSAIMALAEPDYQLGVAIDAALAQCGYVMVVEIDAWVKPIEEYIDMKRVALHQRLSSPPDDDTRIDSLRIRLPSSYTVRTI